MKTYHSAVRKLHLYLGLFISPLVLIYSFSILSFNHPEMLKRIDPVITLPEIRTKLDNIPFDTSDLATVKAICRKLGITGEIDFISRGKDFISFPVNTPGLQTSVRVNTVSDSALIIRKQQGSIHAMGFLHKMPGPHNERIRGNSIFIQIWRVMTNVVVYALLFLTVSGVFLWYFLTVERRLGLFAITSGLCLFIFLLMMIL